MQIIPLQAVASQILATTLNGQNVQLAVYQKDQGLFVDLSDITVGVLALNGVPLTVNYSGFDGQLLFVDMLGTDAPYYTGLGTRWVLVYLTGDEYAGLI